MAFFLSQTSEARRSVALHPWSAEDQALGFIPLDAAYVQSTNHAMSSELYQPLLV
jgi:hypothetical protein